MIFIEFLSQIWKSDPSIESPDIASCIRIFNHSFYCQGKFFWISQSSKRSVFHHTFQELWTDATTHRSLENPWSNCHNPYFIFSKVSSHWQCHSNECSLRSRIHNLPFLTLKSSNTSNINNNSSLTINLFLFRHNLRSMLRNIQSSNNINLQNFLHNLRGDNTFREYCGTSWNDSCAVYNHMDFLVSVQCEFYKILNILLICHIGLEKHAPQSWCNLSATLFIEICNDYIGLLSSEQLNCCKSQPRSPSCHNGNQRFIDSHQIINYRLMSKYYIAMII